MAERGYAAGWRKFALMSGKAVPEWLWREGAAEPQPDHPPFDRPFHLIMNLAVGGDFFKGNLNPENAGASLYDVPIAESGQLPSMFWYSRMKAWWASWAKGGGNDALPRPFAQASMATTGYLEPRNTWSAFASGGQDAGRPSKHKADALADEPPPADEEIAPHADFVIHRVAVWPVEGSEMTHS